MNIFPVKKLKLETSLTIDEIRERIARASKYKISIDGNNFEIIRITKHRHFPPLIKGCMFDLDNSSIVNITMQLCRADLIFTVLWIVFAAVILCFIIMNQALCQIDITLYILPFLGVLVTYILFSFECSKSKKDLLNILDAKIVE